MIPKPSSQRVIVSRGGPSVQYGHDAPSRPRRKAFPMFRRREIGPKKNGVLGCKTLSPKRSVGLQHPKP